MNFTIAGPDERIVELRAGGEKYEALLGKLKDAIGEAHARGMEG